MVDVTVALMSLAIARGTSILYRTIKKIRNVQKATLIVRHRYYLNNELKANN
jgi:hypothetical protein